MIDFVAQRGLLAHEGFNPYLMGRVKEMVLRGLSYDLGEHYRPEASLSDASVALILMITLLFRESGASVIGKGLSAVVSLDETARLTALSRDDFVAAMQKYNPTMNAIMERLTDEYAEVINGFMDETWFSKPPSGE